MKWLNYYIRYKAPERKDQVVYYILLVFQAIILLCFFTQFINFIILRANYHGGSVIVTLFLAIVMMASIRIYHTRFRQAINFGLLFLILLCYSYVVFNSGITNLYSIFLMVFYVVLSAIIFRGWRFFSNILLLFAIFVAFSVLQIKGYFSPDLSWANASVNYADTAAIIVVLMIIIFISWLFNSEINNYIAQLEKSEKLLKKERDLLEIRVKERTAQLITEQEQRVAELTKFAEFGRLAGGLFHDLINPLTALSLNLNQLKNNDDISVDKFKVYASGATIAANNMARLINSTQNYFHNKIEKTSFSVQDELDNVQEILKYKARKANVNLVFENKDDAQLFGDKAKFAQVLANLVANAIEAFVVHQEETKQKKEGEVLVKLIKLGNSTRMIVKDNAGGIPEKAREKIFRPFYTTKKKYGNTGIGLATCKDIIENDFRGSIDVVSTPKKGSEFRVIFPKNLAKPRLNAK